MVELTCLNLLENYTIVYLYIQMWNSFYCTSKIIKLKKKHF